MQLTSLVRLSRRIALRCTSGLWLIGKRESWLLISNSFLSVLFAPATTYAIAPCDASVEVRDCRAVVTLEGKFVVLKSDTPNCSVIEWALDGGKRLTTVIDGEERLELLTSSPKEITVESCTEVRDLRGSLSPGRQSSQQQPSAGLQTGELPNFGRYCSGKNVRFGFPLYREEATLWYCRDDAENDLVWCKSTPGSEPAKFNPQPTSNANRRFHELSSRTNRTSAEEEELQRANADFTAEIRAQLEYKRARRARLCQ